MPATAIVAFVAILKRRIRSANEPERKLFGHCDFIVYYRGIGQGVAWRRSIWNDGRRSVQEKRARTRAQLMAAASALFAKRSWASVTIDDLVREAGVAKGTFYVHFEDMHALTVAVAGELIHSFDEMIQLRRASTSDPLLRVAFGCDAFIERALEDPGVGRAGRAHGAIRSKRRRKGASPSEGGSGARARQSSRWRPFGGSCLGGGDRRRAAGARRDRRGSPQGRRRTTCSRRGARVDWNRKAAGGDNACEAQARQGGAHREGPGRVIRPRAGSGRGEDGDCLFAEVERAVGAENARRDQVAGPKIFRPAPLRIQEQLPEPPFGQELDDAANRGRRKAEGAAARRSRQQYVAGRDIGEGGQFGNRLGRLEYEIPRRIPLPDRVVDRKKQLEVVEAGEFVRVGHGQPRADRAEAAIALALEECICGSCTSRALKSFAMATAKT